MKRLRTDDLIVNRAAARIPREIHERIMEDPAWRHLMDTKLLAPRRSDDVEHAGARAIPADKTI